MSSIYKKVGVEVELIAPVGSSRLDYAKAVAVHFNGQVEPYFHIDTEPSKVKGKPFFYHITQAFKVIDADKQLIVKCVDDITLQADLNKSTKPKSGWYRVLSDDLRLLRLIRRHADVNASIASVLQPVAGLFGVTPEQTIGGVFRLTDESGASVALAAPLPGERERACELVSSPLLSSQLEQLDRLLKIAEVLRFSVPYEGATHLHFDGELFCDARMFQKTINFLHDHRLLLRVILEVNPNCRRIAAWKPEFLDVVNQVDFAELNWEEVRKRLKVLNISKYHEFNVRNLIQAVPDKHTFEVRILPSSLSVQPMIRAIGLFEKIFLYLQAQAAYRRVGEIPVTKQSLASFKCLFDC